MGRWPYGLCADGRTHQGQGRDPPESQDGAELDLENLPRDLNGVKKEPGPQTYQGSNLTFQGHFQPFLGLLCLISSSLQRRDGF